jgi:hypothetical protein
VSALEAPPSFVAITVTDFGRVVNPLMVGYGGLELGAGRDRPMADLFGRGIVAGQPPLDKFAPGALVQDNFALTAGTPNSVPAQPEMETERFPLVSIPPFGWGFSRHGGLSIRCGFGKSAKDGFRACLDRLDEPTRLSLGMVASPQWGTRPTVWTRREGTVVYAEDASGVGS